MVKTKVKVHLTVPAVTVWPECTESVSVSELNAPFPCIELTENRSAALFVTVVRARLEVSGAPVSPDIVTAELSVPSKLTLVAIVTVIVFATAATGVLWPTVCEMCTVSVSVSEFNTPFPVVNVPDTLTENRFAALFATLVRVRLAASGAPVSPDIVT